MGHRRTGAQLVQAFIEANDIRYVFGNPGATETPFLAALMDTGSEYVLAVHESSAVGIAAGYALVTGKPSLVNLHTYPGLANGISNLRNARDSRIPMLVINGTQDSRFLIHNPPLAGPTTQLAETATKYQYQVAGIDELAVALQRCYIQASVQPAGPVFLSVPMDLMRSVTDRVSIRRTRVLDDSVSASIGEVVAALWTARRGRLVIVADHAVGWDDEDRSLSRVAQALGADVYAAPFDVQGAVNTLDPRFNGQLPAETGQVRQMLSRYHTMLLVGDKLDARSYLDGPAMPPGLKVIQITAATTQLGFDWPVDVAVVGDVAATLERIAGLLGVDADTMPTAEVVPDEAGLEAATPRFGPHAGDSVILTVLQHLDRRTHVVTEGSSQDAVVQDLSTALGFRNVHFGPRAGGHGWAMPLAVGIALATGRHSVCFLGEAASLFSVQTIWTAAAHRIPVVFVCFVNQEYQQLKDQLAQVMGGPVPEARVAGLDLTDPDIDLAGIATAFGARTQLLDRRHRVRAVIAEALEHRGPSLLIIRQEHEPGPDPPDTA